MFRKPRRNGCRRFVAVLLTIFAPAGLTGRSTAAIETQQRSEGRIDIPAEGASVPMLDIGGRPMAEIRLNGKGPFPFILDTGAMRTVIDVGLSAELVPGSSGHGSQIKELAIGSIRFADLAAEIAPVSAMFGKVDNPPRGVLSALSFPGYLVAFDYPRKRIILRKGALPKRNGKTIFAYGVDEMLPTVPVNVAGRKIKVHFDTGAPFAVALPTKYKDEIPLTAPAEEQGKARSHSGEFPMFKGTVKGEITIGEYKLATREVVFTDVVPYPGATPQGQIGYGVLRDFRVTLDSANRRIEFSKDADEVSTGR